MTAPTDFSHDSHDAGGPVSAAPRTPTPTASPPQSPQSALPVALVCNSVPPYRLHLHRRIVRELPEVWLWTVVTGDDPRWPTEPPADIHPVRFGRGPENARRGWRRLLRDWRRGGRIISWLRRRGVRALVVSGYNNATLLRLILWSDRAGLPCFLAGDSNVRSDQVGGLKLRAKRWYLGTVVRHCSGVLPFGSLGRAFFEKYGADPGRVFYFPLEPDYGMVERVAADQVAEQAARFGLVRGRRRIVYSGRLAAPKRVDLLLDAFATLAPVRPEWDLLLVGDGPERAALEARLPGAMADRVIWAGHLEDPSLLSALYHSCDLLVLPSDYEPWGLVVNEAAAAGLALVCSDAAGAAPELVRDVFNGRVFPAGNLQALVECLLDVTQPQALTRMKSASADVLAEWRRHGDPVAGLRAALRRAGVLRG
jgi:glycosyltransferase involved in cell wall biosynthesis